MSEAVRVTMGEGEGGEATVPRMKKSIRGREVRLNDLAYRMAWLQSRVFAGRTVFLQRASKSTLHGDDAGGRENADMVGDSGLLSQQDAGCH